MMKRKIVYVDNFLTGHGHTPTTGTTLVKLFKEEGYEVVQTSSRQNQFFRLADMIATIIQHRRQSVVLIATYSTSAFFFAYACTFICRLFHIPYIPCLHGGNLPQRIAQSPKLARSVFGRSYMNVAVSGYLHKSMTDNGWKSMVIPNNIHISAYPYKQRTECKPHLLWVRSFHKIYNPLLAIRVLHAISQKCSDATLTMVGPDKDGSLAHCLALVKELNLQQQVRFTGLLTRDEWVKLSSDNDIFINTTNFDNLPVSVVEAMALGLVTISTNVGGVPYLVDDHENGLLVPPANEAAFVEAIEKVLHDPLLAQKLSSNARKKALSYDWSNIKGLWSDLLDGVK